MQLWVETEVLRLTNLRASQNRKAGNPGPEGSIAKLMFAEVNKDIFELCVDLQGADGLVGYDYTMRRSDVLGPGRAPRHVAQVLPAVAGQLDRGRHLGDPAQHPGRAHPRAARRRAGRQGAALVEGPAQLSAPRPTGAPMTDARQFLGMEERGDPLHWRLEVVPELTTPGNFLFGGCGLGAALVALEAAVGPADGVVDGPVPVVRPDRRRSSTSTVTLAAEGHRVTQARAVGTVGDTEILTVNAALGLPAVARRRGRVGRAARRAAARRVPAPAPARRSSPPRSSTRSTCGWPRAGPSRRSARGTAPRASRTAPCGPGCPATSSPRRPPWPSSATT